ncbi:MAG: protein pelota [archaeon GW2011_AR17]|nr:MAG: protein pelota [archaeon GW2011_AR17]MBS3154348.1 mRNA surveillance protein pelota [Candidatus Woesearchaeota archaeon]HIH15286.1 mRNA surveillance protein pelota [Nanoarchaeota archaeon]HIH58559.1 mRNA surveillance protein pelota [Nanoarchaeota archaeon]HII13754.1 mRNA surveillance protein pelota [Nanoarchaeota archaeon]
MKIIFQDLQKGELKIEITTLDDLWYLSHCIEINDQVQGRTLRKIKLGDDSDKNVKIIKKPVTLKINVERVEFQKFSNNLRISGKITEAPEDIPHASYHTIEVEEGTVIKIIKKSWPKYLLQKIKDACEDKGSKILIVALERDEVTYALLTSSGYKILADLEGEVGKKGYADIQEKEFYTEVAKHLDEYVQRYSIEHIIIASPAFWKEDLFQIIKKKYSTLTKKITLATCNTTGKNAIEEVLKRDEVKTVLKDDRTTQETALIEELLEGIAKNSLVAYGEKEVKESSEAHAIKILLISDLYIQEQREAGKYLFLDTMMREVERSNGEVHIISSEHDAGKKLYGLGGIGAILRYNLK